MNLIGEHTDYTGGLALPFAIDRHTEIELERGMPWIELISADEPEPAVVFLDEPIDPATVRPEWARYVAGVASVIGAQVGGRGFVRTTIPIGAGLSSSAALEVAVALALGFDGTPVQLAQACQQAEQLAAGVPCGILDQLTSAAAIAGHALFIDCRTLAHTPVAIPDGLDLIVVDSGQRRSLVTSFYGVRRAQCEEAEMLIGPLRDASVADAESIELPELRRRARHVVAENARVMSFVDALTSGDLTTAGALLDDGHRSLRDDFEVSTPVVDALVEAVRATPGVLGARMTGAGFGGCVIAMAEPGAEIRAGEASWRVAPVGGATVVEVRDP